MYQILHSIYWNILFSLKKMNKLASFSYLVGRQGCFNSLFSWWWIYFSDMTPTLKTINFIIVACKVESVMMSVDSLFSLILETHWWSFHFEQVSHVCMILHLHALAVKKVVIMSDSDIFHYTVYNVTISFISFFSEAGMLIQAFQSAYFCLKIELYYWQCGINA